MSDAHFAVLFQLPQRLLVADWADVHRLLRACADKPVHGGNRAQGGGVQYVAVVQRRGDRVPVVDVNVARRRRAPRRVGSGGVGLASVSESSERRSDVNAASLDPLDLPHHGVVHVGAEVRRLHPPALALRDDDKRLGIVPQPQLLAIGGGQRDSDVAVFVQRRGGERVKVGGRAVAEGGHLSVHVNDRMRRLLHGVGGKRWSFQ
mmetsp:Transcript_17569/g.54460  ORF Transcript_17569/g.54460 Transcript_17569/m.54460 type:complete len:205 (-) Transcript_17569:18-632(-)